MKKFVFLLALSSMLLCSSVYAKDCNQFSNFAEYNSDIYGHWETRKNMGTPADVISVPESAYDFCIYNDSMYYYNIDDGYIHKCNLDQSNDTIYIKDCNCLHPTIWNNKIYYQVRYYDEKTDVITYTICYKDLSTAKITNIKSFNTPSVVSDNFKNDFMDILYVDDDYVYFYISNDNKFTLYKMEHTSNNIENMITLDSRKGYLSTTIDKVTKYEDHLVLYCDNTYTGGGDNFLVNIDTTTNKYTITPFYNGDSVVYLDNNYMLIQSRNELVKVDIATKDYKTIFSYDSDKAISMYGDIIYNNILYFTINDFDDYTSYGYKLDLKNGKYTILKSWELLGNG